MAFDTHTSIGVVGAGAMGRGIAQVAAAAGHTVVLGDAAAGVAQKAQGVIGLGLDRDVEKGRKSRDVADAILGRIQFQWEPLAEDLGAYRRCGIVIEAVVEDLDVKRDLFRRLEGAVSNDSVLATNTSSLSVTSIAAACQSSSRVMGVHFFNPATILPLVEIVPWMGTDAMLTTSMHQLIQSWGKTPVLASDTPGFIVNRIARPFYGEALRMLEEGLADVPTIDWAMKEVGEFKMGPFELMDFIGNDVNFAVTKSVYEGFFHDPRYRPSLTQKRLVEAGFLGKKAGRGYYNYADGATNSAPNKDPALGLLVFERILAMLINEAIDAVHMQVASPQDVDLAMTKGVNYPRGLLAWANEIGLARVLGWMERLQLAYGEDRYRPSLLLRQMVSRGEHFFA